MLKYLSLFLVFFVLIWIANNLRQVLDMQNYLLATQDLGSCGSCSSTSSQLSKEENKKEQSGGSYCYNRSHNSCVSDINCEWDPYYDVCRPRTYNTGQYAWYWPLNVFNPVFYPRRFRNYRRYRPHRRYRPYRRYRVWY